MAACDSGSAAWKLAMVWSENTTPQPKVSSGRLRSKTSMLASGMALRSRIAAYSPAGPPPTQTIRLIPAGTPVAALLQACRLCYIASYFRCQSFLHRARRPPHTRESHEHGNAVSRQIVRRSGATGGGDHRRAHPRRGSHGAAGTLDPHDPAAAPVRALPAPFAGGG